MESAKQARATKTILDFMQRKMREQQADRDTTTLGQAETVKPNPRKRERPTELQKLDPQWAWKKRRL